MRKYVLTKLVDQLDPRHRMEQWLVCLTSIYVFLIVLILVFQSELPYKEPLEILLAALLVYSLLKGLWLWQFRYLTDFINWDKVVKIADYVYDYDPGSHISVHDAAKPQSGFEDSVADGSEALRVRRGREIRDLEF